MRAWLLLGVLGCTPRDPLDEAWNRVFQVTSYASAPGCATPTEAQDPPAEYVAIGLGRTFDGLFLASSFWCDSATACRMQPFSNAVLDVVEEDHLLGFFVRSSFDSLRVCRTLWFGIDAMQQADGTLTLVTRAHEAEVETQPTSEDCDSYVLDVLLGEVCDETVHVQAARLP